MRLEKPLTVSLNFRSQKMEPEVLQNHKKIKILSAIDQPSQNEASYKKAIDAPKHTDKGRPILRSLS